MNYIWINVGDIEDHRNSKLRYIGFDGCVVYHEQSKFVPYGEVLFNWNMYHSDSYGISYQPIVYADANPITTTNCSTLKEAMAKVERFIEYYNSFGVELEL